MKNFFGIILIISLLSVLMSCSGCSPNPPVYLSPEYEYKQFNNSSIALCIPDAKFEYSPGLDSERVTIMRSFSEDFLKYFPEGIKMISSVNRIGIIQYESNTNKDFTDYEINKADGSKIYISLPEPVDSLSKISNSDFLFIIQNIIIYWKEPSTHGFDKKYVSKVHMEYSLWDCANSNPVMKDTVTSTSFEFYKSDGRWPFKNVILKLAELVFDKLPMFSK